MTTQEQDNQIHLDFRGQEVSVTALSMGEGDHDCGLLIRSAEQSVAVVLDAEGEKRLFAQVFMERKERSVREHLRLVPTQD